MNNYTKGKWKIVSDEMSILICDEVGRVIVVVKDGSYEEKVANAQLIASAPDLYEALKGCADIVAALDGTGDTPLGRQIAKALAKVEGK